MDEDFSDTLCGRIVWLFVVKDSISTSNIHLRSTNGSKNQKTFPENKHPWYSDATRRVTRPTHSPRSAAAPSSQAQIRRSDKTRV